MSKEINLKADAAKHAVELMGNIDPEDFEETFKEMNSTTEFDKISGEYSDLLPKKKINNTKDENEKCLPQKEKNDDQVKNQISLNFPEA